MPFAIQNSDKQVVRQVLAGRRDRFGILVERHQALVHAVAFAHTKSLADAEDVVQDAFLKAYESLPTLRDPGRFRPWVATIARRTAFSLLRHRQRDACVPSGDGTVAPMAEGRIALAEHSLPGGAARRPKRYLRNCWLGLPCDPAIARSNSRS